MYEELVAEYLAFEIPPYVRRNNALGELPIPQRRNLIMAIIGVRRCGKTFQLFQAMNELMRSGVSRELFFTFPSTTTAWGSSTSLQRPGCSTPTTRSCPGR